MDTLHFTINILYEKQEEVAKLRLQCLLTIHQSLIKTFQT